MAPQRHPVDLVGLPAERFGASGVVLRIVSPDSSVPEAPKVKKVSSASWRPGEVRTVTVKGFSERLVKADIGFLPVRFNAVGPDLETARGLLERSEQAVFRYLESKGFSSDDWEVQNVRVEDRMAAYNASATPRPTPLASTTMKLA